MTATSVAPRGAPTGGLHFTPQLAAIGVIGGVLSGLLGVGGGVVMVPLMVFWASIDQRSAHALSLGAVIPIAVGGLATYGIAGEIEIVHAIGLAIGAVVGARIGAGALARIDQRALALAFSAVLILSAIALVVE